MDPLSQESLAVQPGTPEHEDGMIEQFDARQQQPQEKPSEAPVRPAHVPEKFWDAKTGQVNTEALLKSYTELEKTRAPSPKQAQTEQAPVEQGEAEKALESAGLDFNTFADSYAQNGALTDADYTQLENAGIPRSMVDAFIEGQKALVDSTRNEVLSAIGGEENFEAMSAWASQNLSPSELQAYNNAVDSGDPGYMSLAVQGLYSRYQQHAGNEPTLVGGTRNAETGDKYRSTAELTADMRDPRYKRDPAFRSDVEAKLARSDIF
jgi:hypothetical protein